MKQEKKVEKIHQTKTQLFWEVVRFLLMGGIATICDYIVFYVLRQWILPEHLVDAAAWDVFSLVFATASGFIVGLIVSWILSVRIVFQSVGDKEQAHSKKSFMLFAIIGFIGLLITEFGVVLLVGILSEITLFRVEAFLGLPWKEWIAKVIMTWIVLVWNYLGRKIFIFKL